MTCIALSSMTNELKTLVSLAYVEQMAHTLFIVPCNNPSNDSALFLGTLQI